MYARQPPSPRIPRPIEIPKNYSGNAFMHKATEEMSIPNDLPPSEPEAKEETEPTEQVSPTVAEEAALPVSHTKNPLLSLFSKGNRQGGLGSEELLLLGLLLLISQNDSRDDLLFLLLLLLFIG